MSFKVPRSRSFAASRRPRNPAPPVIRTFTAASSEHLRAGVDVNGGAGDRSGALGTEERHGEGELVRPRLAFDRVELPRALGAVLRRHARVRGVVAHGLHEPGID